MPQKRKKEPKLFIILEIICIAPISAIVKFHNWLKRSMLLSILILMYVSMMQPLF